MMPYRLDDSASKLRKSAALKLCTEEDSIKQKHIFLSDYTCYYTNIDPNKNEKVK